MCVPLVLAKQKKSKEVKWAREFYFEKSRKRPITEGRKKEPAIVSSSSSSSSQYSRKRDHLGACQRRDSRT